MTFQKIKNKIALVLCAFLIISAVLGVCFFGKPVKASAPEITTNAIMTNYVIGDTFTVPDVKVSYGGKEYDATNGVLVMPDGSAYAKGSYFLDQLGKYTVKYSIVDDNDKTVYVEKSFNVEKSIYDVTSTLSSAVFVDEIPTYEGVEDTKKTPWAGTDKLVFDEDGNPVYVQEVDEEGNGVVDKDGNPVYKQETDKDGNPVFNQDGSPKYVQQTRKYMPEGVTVTLAEGEYFNFYKPYNLKEVGISELIHFYTPYSDGIYVAEDIVLRVTDCYDSENYIEMLVEFSGDVEHRSNPAGGRDGYMFKPSDKQLGKYAETYIDGVLYSCRFDNYGPVRDTKKGRVRNLKFGFDASTNYTKCLNNSGDWVTIVDVANEAFFGDNAFKGFTTGEVFLSVYGKKYAEAKPFEMSIIEIGGVSGDDLKLQNYQDTVKPVIEVDYQEIDENGVYIVKGEEFEVFPAKAYDINLLGDVSSCVYYCGSNYNINVPMTNGKFTPDKIGTYKIVYSATDRYGNVGTKECYLTCVETENGKSVSLDIGEKFTELKTGEDVVVPMATVEGLNGNENLKIVLVEPDGNQKELENGQSLIFAKSGEYKLIYQYSDVYNSYSEEYTFQVNSSDVVRFIDDPVLPRHLIANAKYSIDPLYAYDYTGAVVSEHLADVYVKFDDGEFSKIDINSFQIPVDAKNAFFKYVYQDAVYLVQDAIPVVFTGVGDPMALQFVNYFVGGYEAVPFGSSYIFKSSVDFGSSEFQYVNKAMIDNFALSFWIPTDYSDFTSFNVTFTDYYDSDKKVVISFRRSGDALFFDINGEGNHVVRKNFADDTNQVSITYNPLYKQFEISNVGQFSFEHGFTTAYCNLDFSFEGVNGNGGVIINQFYNQFMSSGVLADRIAPVVSFVRDTSTMPINSKFVINRAYAIDVITPILNETFGLSVVDPAGNFVKSGDVLLDGTAPATRTYEIDLLVSGTYVIKYAAKDQNNRTGSATLNLEVVSDNNGPRIELLSARDGIVEFALGQTHTVKATFSDNQTVNKDIRAYVAIQYKGSYCYFEKIAYNKDIDAWAGVAYKPITKGEYTVYIYAYDELGNTSVATYKLNVK